MIGKLPLQKLHLYVAAAIVIFLGVQILKYFSVAAPDWVFFYLNDFLSIPIVATLGLHGVWLIKKDKSIRLKVFDVLSLVVLFSVYFEYYLPQKSHRYTGDIWDVACYAAGGVVFYILQKME